jgi:hypothetical protein
VAAAWSGQHFTDMALLTLAPNQRLDDFKQGHEAVVHVYLLVAVQK